VETTETERFIPVGTTEEVNEVALSAKDKSTRAGVYRFVISQWRLSPTESVECRKERHETYDPKDVRK